MNHWLCGSCRAYHRDMIVRYNLTDKDLRRALRAMLKYERLPLWRKLFSGPLYAICNTLAGWMLGKSLRMSEDCAYVDVAEGRDSAPFYVPFPDTLSPRHRKIWAYTYVNGLLRYN